MSNLIDEITQADADLQRAEATATEASARLRHAKRDLRDCRQELSRLIKELKTGESRYPIFERIERSNGPTELPEANTGTRGRKKTSP